MFGPNQRFQSRPAQPWARASRLPYHLPTQQLSNLVANFCNVRCAALVALIATFLLTACATSPLGRSQLVLFPAGEMQKMGVSAYTEMKKQTPATKNARQIRYVQCVADHIIRAMPNTDPAGWEVTVFEDEQANAFALPGGKIGVYTGLLNVAENQDQLATVMGHEVAHVLANHSNERVSTSSLTNLGVQLAQVAAGASGTKYQNELMGLLGLGAQVGVTLPFGRTQESEADLLGLDLMANAGFDPRQSVYLWENMNKAAGQKPPEFLSTHPSGDRRIKNLNDRMDAAMKLSLAARQAGRSPDCG